jgi:hypothetical protein
VDRLTTGRRHVRAGSVTVSELLVRQAAPTRCTDSAPPTEPRDLFGATSRAEEQHAPDGYDENANATTATIAAVAALPPTHRRSPARGAQLAKLATLGVAGAVLCGAVTISSMIATQRRETTQPAGRPTIQITGDQALLPDQLNTRQAAPVPASPPVAANPPSVAQDSLAPPAQPPATPVTQSSGSGADSGTTTGADAAPPEPSPASDLDLVREFYENLPGSPASAFDLLAPELVDTSLGEFLRSWSIVREIESLHLTAREDGVLATVRMRLHGGGHLLIQQLLTVAESPRRIVGVELLSAQRN